jgi:hypothetical protein
MRITKLDRRYRGFGTWTHRAEAGSWYGGESRRQGLVNFFEQREFLSRSFGMGAFVEEVGALEQSGREIPKWGFDMEGNIFLREEALVQFELAKGRWE